jgi:type II secretory pathway pseudopilin PulG
MAERAQLPDSGGGVVNSQRGTSLLELLVAQALALLLMTGVLQALSQGLAQQRQLEDQAALEESTQWLALVLQHNLASAGFVDWTDGGWPHPGSRAEMAAQTLPSGLALFACPGDMQGSALQNAAAPASDRWSCGAVRPGRQTLQVVRQGSPSPGSKPEWRSNWNAQAGKDCLQQDSKGPWVVNRFYIGASNLGSQLLCAGSGNQTGQALVSGVEEWVLRFLVQHPDGQTQWIATADMGPAEAANWQGVVRVEVCWVLVSASAGRGGSQSWATGKTRPTCLREPNGQWQPGVTREPGDRRLWRRHSQTIAVLNTAIGLP